MTQTIISYQYYHMLWLNLAIPPTAGNFSLTVKDTVRHFPHKTM